MKKIFPISLLFLFLFNVIVFYPVFFFLQQDAKEKMEQKIKQSISENELIVISVSESESRSIQWLNDDEFRYHGNVYDVVKKETDKNNTTRFYCINDSKEKELFASLDNHIANDIGTNVPSKDSKDSVKDFIKDYFLHTEKFIFYSSAKSISYTFQSSFLLSFILEKQSPPPKSV